VKYCIVLAGSGVHIAGDLLGWIVGSSGDGDIFWASEEAAKKVASRRCLSHGFTYEARPITKQLCQAYRKRPAVARTGLFYDGTWR
jgi:hypothetical protein